MIKAKKKNQMPKLKKKVWELCKQITRLTYQNQDGSWNCFTCGRRIDEPIKAQTGHFIPSSTCGAFLRYDLRNLRVQCYFCNINCGGSGVEYYKKLVEEKGQEYVDQLFRDKNVTLKADSIFYTALITDYENKLEELTK